jgi:hypothetical protein
MLHELFFRNLSTQQKKSQMEDAELSGQSQNAELSGQILDLPVILTGHFR